MRENSAKDTGKYKHRGRENGGKREAGRDRYKEIERMAYIFLWHDDAKFRSLPLDRA